MDDRTIIELYQKRDERAIQATDDCYGSYCRSIALAILDSRADAEECVNDTYLRAWNAIPPQCPAKLSAFLGRITRNLSVDRARKNRAEKRGGGVYTQLLEELEPFLPADDDVEHAVETAELAQAINDFLRTLRERDCALFLQRYFYARSCKEIALRYGMSEGSVKTALHRTRKKLQTYLKKEDLIL